MLLRRPCSHRSAADPVLDSAGARSARPRASTRPRRRGAQGHRARVSTFSESTHTAADAAAALGAGLGQIVKSLVFVVPASDGARADPLSRLGRQSRRHRAAGRGHRRAVAPPRDAAREANDLTGFTIGGIRRSATRSPLRVVMDPDLGRYETVWAAAGLPNAVFPVPPATCGSCRTRTSRRSPRWSARPTWKPPSAADHSGERTRRHGGRAAQRGGDLSRRPAGALAVGGQRPGREVFALTEAGGSLLDLGTHVSTDPDALCRAEVRIEGPRGRGRRGSRRRSSTSPSGSSGTRPACWS